MGVDDLEEVNFYSVRKDKVPEGITVPSIKK